MNKKSQRNIAQAALFLTHYGYYGSEQKAVAALKRRVDTKDLSKDDLSNGLVHALEILHKVDHKAKSILFKNKVSSHSQLTLEEHTAGSESLRAILIQDYPEDAVVIDYFISMNWHMPFYR